MGHTSDSFTADGGFIGDVTGNVTGNVTGDVTGDLTGDVTGDVTGDLTGSVGGATTFSMADGNGGTFNIGFVTELVTIAAAATTASTIQIPAGGKVLFVTARTTVATTTAVSYDLGITGDTARFLADAETDLSQESTAVGRPDVATDDYASATTLLFTPDATPGDANGRVRLTIWYMTATAPTS